MSTSAALRVAALTVLALAVAAMFAVGCLSNFAHAYQIAGDSPWAHVFGAASAAADVLKAAAIVAMVAAFRRKFYLAGLACLLIWVCTTAWSVRSGLGFISTTLSDTSAERTKASGDGKSLSSELDDTIKSIPWLEKASSEAKTDRERTRLDAKIDKARKRIDDLRDKGAATKAVAGVDPVAAMLEKHFGATEEKTMLATAFAFLLMLEFCSNLGLLAFGHMFTAPPPAPPRKEEKRKEPRIYVPPSGATPPAASKPTLAIDNTASQPRPRRFGRIHPKSSRATVAMFLAETVGTHGDGAEVWTKQVQADYAAWSAKVGEKEIAPWHLGQQLGCLGVTKTERDGKTYYVLPSGAPTAMAATAP